MFREIVYSIIFVIILIVLVKLKVLTVTQVSDFLNMVGGFIKMIGRAIIDGIISVLNVI